MYAKKMTLLAALLATASGAGAATSQVDFNVEAVIPDNEFYVTPVNGWNAQTQKMAWNAATKSLAPISQQLQMRNDKGGIKAYLAGEPVLSSSGGADNIALDVTIAGQTLPTNATNAVTIYDNASVEKTATMTVSQKGTTPGPGTYMGAVTLMFDAVIKP